MTETLRKATDRDIPELKKLWLRCFEDTEQAAGLFFERNKDIRNSYLAEQNGKITAAVYLISCTLNGKNAHYLCGAGTLPEFRNRGIMSRLIEYALNDAENRGDFCSVLLPANEGLYSFYSRLGYEPKCETASANFTREELEADCSLGLTEGKIPGFEQAQLTCRKDNFLLQKNSFVSFAKEYYSCYGAKIAESQNALAFFEEQDGACTAFYTIYNDVKELKTLLLKSSNAKSFVIFGKSGEEIFNNSNIEIKTKKYGMARALNPTASLPDDIYIGITMD